MRVKNKKGGAAGDPFDNNRIAGPVMTMPTTSFESDKGIPANMQYSTTAAQLAQVNVFEGGAKTSSKNPKLYRHTVIARENDKLENRKINDAVNALLKLKIDYQPAVKKTKQVKFSKKIQFKTPAGYEVSKYSSSSIDLNKKPASKGGKKTKK